MRVLHALRQLNAQYSFKISKTLMLDVRWDGVGTMSQSFAGPLEYKILSALHIQRG